MNFKKKYESLVSELLLKFAKIIVDPSRISELQQGILDIGRKNPEHLNEAVYLANYLTKEGDMLVTTFREDQLPSGERK